MLGAEIWNYPQLVQEREAAAELPEHEQPGVDLTGFSVEAIDGHIGKVDRASYEVDGSSLVVDTGPWIFGRKVLLPAGLIDHIDALEKVVYVRRLKDEIKGAPEFHERLYADAGYRAKLGSYYGRDGNGHRELDGRPMV
jgi:hypothetical protein